MVVCIYQWNIPTVLIRNYLNLVHQADPQHAPALSLLGRWYIEQAKDYTEAQKWLSKALTIHPEHAETNHLMGRLYLDHLALDAKTTQRGLAFLEEAHRLEPTVAKYSYDWVKALHQTGQTDALHHTLKQITRRFHRHRPLLLWAGSYFLYEKNDLSEVRFYYQRLNRLHDYPYHAETFVFLGVCEILLSSNPPKAAYLFESIRHTEVPPPLWVAALAFTHLMMDCQALHTAMMVNDEYELDQLRTASPDPTVTQ